MGGSAWWPGEASDYAWLVDLLLLALALIGAALVIAVVVAIAAAGRVSRRGAAAGRTPGPPLSRRRALGWLAVSALGLLALYLWAARLAFDLERPPADAIRIDVLASRWTWLFVHPEGRRELNELHVPAGQAVALKMTSQDVIHDLAVPALRIGRDILPGRFTTLWFAATVAGEYRLVCDRYCGAGHAAMSGRVVVLAPDDYQQWLERGLPVVASAGGAARAGKERSGR